MDLNISGLVAALLAFYGVHSFNQYKKRNNQDDQTEWVPRLIKVATETTAQSLSEKDFYQILNTLRPFVNNCDENYVTFESFTNHSIRYCKECLEQQTHDNKSIQAKKLRLIANVLLKYHWEIHELNNSSFFMISRSVSWKNTFKPIWIRKREHKEKIEELFQNFFNEFKSY